MAFWSYGGKTSERGGGGGDSPPACIELKVEFRVIVFGHGAKTIAWNTEFLLSGTTPRIIEKIRVIIFIQKR